MSVLSDRDIAREVAYKEDGLHINPYKESNLQPASYDLMLGRKMYHVDSDTLIDADTHTIKPFERYLGHTKENISLSKDLAAQVSGRSSMGRKGIIVHKTAGWIDPNFSGDITLEIMNLGSEPVELNSGKRVAQMILFRLENISSGYEGKYQNQNGPTKLKPDK